MLENVEKSGFRTLEDIPSLLLLVHRDSVITCFNPKVTVFHPLSMPFCWVRDPDKVYHKGGITSP
ncbi:MAG: hypothetical protein ABEK04_03460, partial [Candidatus Nanohalobium sp.]